MPDVALAQLEKWSQARSLDELTQIPTGIIILGGSLSTNKQIKFGSYHLDDAAERITEGIVLAKKFPGAILLYTGGIGSLNNEQGNEALAFEYFYHRLGAVKNTLLLDGQSKNTWQNAQNSAALIDGMIKNPKDSTWLLVTSANHMPRSLGSFRKVGLNVVGWPTDYRADVLRFPWLVTNSARQFTKLNLLFHELIGIVAYKITGRM